MKHATIAAGLILFSNAAVQALEDPMHAGYLAHELDRLANTGRVLYVAAHPDDENTRLLAYLTNQRHVTTAYLSLTRGSGGQNLIGSESGDLLGVIRTEELLAARRLDGARQYFSRARDFGFSKSAEETLSLWGHDEILADVVWVIRSFQPDVILTRFDENPPNHGHHTASAILAREAFVAAADRERFTEQFARGVEPWQAERLLHNLSTWRPVTIPEEAVAIDVGGYDPRLGMGHGELAALSRTQHKSQGFGRAGERGSLIEHLVPLAGSSIHDDPLERLELTWARYGSDARPLVAALVAARASLDRDEPEKALPALLAARTVLRQLPDDPRVGDGRASVDRIIAATMGLFARARAASPAAAPGTTVDIEIEVIARRPSDARLRRLAMPFADAEDLDEPLPAGRKVEFRREVSLPGDMPISAPFWLAEPPLEGRYHVADPALRVLPRAPAALQVGLDISLGKQRLRLTLPVVHTWNDRVHGERRRAFLVQPPVTVTPLRAAILSVNQQPAPLALRIRAGRDEVQAAVSVAAPDGWTVEPTSVPVRLAAAGDEVVVELEVRASDGAAPVDLQPLVQLGPTTAETWSIREDRIDYEHIPQQQVLRPARVRASSLQLATPADAVLIGYIEGSGDTIAADLEHVGYRVERLDDESLLAGNLQRFAAIVAGIRAYNARPAIRQAHGRLMDYVAGGGVYVVQYNTHTHWDPLPGPLAPYDLSLDRGRVTDQNAPMVAVNPQHPLLLSPNRLEESDFGGWVQERGLYFADSWDEEHFTPIFAIADPGEEPQQGALLVARHGDGRYVYTGLSFFRQLPAGVTGAYRLFANLLAHEPALDDPAAEP